LAIGPKAFAIRFGQKVNQINLKNSARRPGGGFRIEIGRSPAPFDIVIVHSFSRFFRDHFELEFYVRKLAPSASRSQTVRSASSDRRATCFTMRRRRAIAGAGGHFKILERPLARSAAAEEIIVVCNFDFAKKNFSVCRHCIHDKTGANYA
jgi:hypothetical protein